MADWIIVARQTVMDGLCLDWYRNEAAHDRRAWALSASRDGVLVGSGVFLDRIPSVHLDNAMTAYRLMSTRRDANVELARRMATHRSVGLRGDLEPMAAAQT